MCLWLVPEQPWGGRPCFPPDLTGVWVIEKKARGGVPAGPIPSWGLSDSPFPNAPHQESPAALHPVTGCSQVAERVPPCLASAAGAAGGRGTQHWLHRLSCGWRDDAAGGMRRNLPSTVACGEACPCCVRPTFGKLALGYPHPHGPLPTSVFTAFYHSDGQASGRLTTLCPAANTHSPHHPALPLPTPLPAQVLDQGLCGQGLSCCHGSGSAASELGQERWHLNKPGSHYLVSTRDLAE